MEPQFFVLKPKSSAFFNGAMRALNPFGTTLGPVRHEGTPKKARL